MTIQDHTSDLIYFTDDIQQTILNNDRIEEKLHVVMVISNPCNFKRRIKLAKEFIQRMKTNTDVILYIVELAYLCNDKFCITKPTNPRHLQLKTKVPLWHKEKI